MKMKKEALVAAPLAIAVVIGGAIEAKPVGNEIKAIGRYVNNLGKPQQQSPDVKLGLESTIRPVALRLARKAIKLSEKPGSQFSVIDDTGSSDPSKLMLAAFTGKGDASDYIEVYLSKVNGKPSAATVTQVEISTATCPTTKGKVDCTEGTTIDLYAPEVKYSGQSAWEARQEGFAELEKDVLGGVTNTANSDSYDLAAHTAVGTAKTIVNDLDAMFDRAYNGE